MPFYTDEAFTPETSVGYLAKRVFHLSAQRLDPVFEAHGLSYLQWAALMSIWWSQDLSCAALARSLAHDTGATTRLLDTLERRGWVERTRGADDRRVVRLMLTDEGRALARVLRAEVSHCWNGWLADWSDADADMLLSLLRRLRDTLETKDAACA